MTYALSTLVQSARITPAPIWRTALACVLDALMLVAGIAATYTLYVSSYPSASIMVGWLTLAFLAWQGVALVRTGQPFGWRLFRVRLVSLGGYPGVGVVRAKGTTYGVADLMRGADPLCPVSRIDGAGDGPAEPNRRARAHRARADRTPADRAPTKRTRVQRAMEVEHPAEDTQRLRRTREAIPVHGGDDVAPDEQTRFNVGASTAKPSVWKPPADVDEVNEPMEEATIFAAQATPQWRVILDGSDMGPLTEPMVFGRNPAPAEGIRTVTVMDLAREVSQQHLRVTVNDVGAAQVEDLGSTNGSTLMRADGSSEPLESGRTYVLTDEMVVQFSGHRLTVTGKTVLS